jgi:hypothetical protein
MCHVKFLRFFCIYLVFLTNLEKNRKNIHRETFIGLSAKKTWAADPLPPSVHIAHICCLYNQPPRPRNPNSPPLPLSRRRLPLPLSPGRPLLSRLVASPPLRLSLLQIRRPPPPPSLPPAQPRRPSSSPSARPSPRGEEQRRDEGRWRQIRPPGASTTRRCGIDDLATRHRRLRAPLALSLSLYVYVCVCVYVCMYGGP